MSRELFDLLQLYRFGCGRRLRCLNGIRASLRAPGLAGLRAEVEAAYAADGEVYQLEQDWSLDPRQTLYAPGVLVPRRALNRALHALHAGLDVVLKGFGADSPQGQAALLVRERVFSAGLRHLTHYDCVSQTTQVEGLLETVEQPDLALALRELQLTQLVERIAEVNREFREHLERGIDRPDYAELRRANRAGEDRLRRVVYLLGARLLTPELSSEEEDELRQAVHCVFDMNREIRIYRKRRRRSAKAKRDEEGEVAEPTIAQPSDPNSGASRAG